MDVVIELWKVVGVGFALWCLLSAGVTLTYVAVRKLYGKRFWQ